MKKAQSRLGEGRAPARRRSSNPEKVLQNSANIEVTCYEEPSVTSAVVFKNYPLIVEAQVVLDLLGLR